jgi:hypothetical protein
MIRPGPCLRPARTSSGGLSTIEVKPGSSAACFGRRGVLEMGRRGGRRVVEEFGCGHLGDVLPIGLDCVRSECRIRADARLAAMLSTIRGLQFQDFD